MTNKTQWKNCVEPINKQCFTSSEKSLNSTIFDISKLSSDLSPQCHTFTKYSENNHVFPRVLKKYNVFETQFKISIIGHYVIIIGLL